MNSQKQISIVVPVYNSQDCIETLVQRIDECFSGEKYELILVNDCSSDSSWKKIEEVIRWNDYTIGINFRKNSGQDNAIMAGFSQVHGDYIVIMDDDLQHDPKDMKKMIEQLETGNFDVCFADFVLKKHKLWKNLGSWFNGKMSEIIIDKPPNIYLSPYKVLRREIVDEINKYRGPYPYVDGLIFTVTQNVTQIPVEHRNRFSGKSNYNFVRSIKVWLKLMTNFSVYPLRIATIIGIMTSILGFILSIFFFVRFFTIGEKVEGWTSLMVIMLILCGIILLAMGVIGEYVGRSYIQLNQRPQYSIKEIINNKSS